MIYFNIIV